MAIVNIGELFKRAESFEHRVERYYAQIRDETENNGVRLLTYYLAKHRRHLEQVLEDIDSAAVALVKEVKLKYDVDFSPEHEFQLFEKDAKSIGSQELLDTAVAYDAALIGLYKKILSQPIGEDAASVFENLVKVEERDIVMIKKMIAMNYF
jgi:rubrerythrin